MRYRPICSKAAHFLGHTVHIYRFPDLPRITEVGTGRLSFRVSMLSTRYIAFLHSSTSELSSTSLIISDGNGSITYTQKLGWGKALIRNKLKIRYRAETTEYKKHWHPCALWQTGAAYGCRVQSPCVRAWAEAKTERRPLSVTHSATIVLFCHLWSYAKPSSLCL